MVFSYIFCTNFGLIISSTVRRSMAHNDQAGGSRTGGDNAYLSMLAQYKHADDEEIEHAADDEMEAPSASEAERGDAGTTTSGTEEGGKARDLQRRRRNGSWR